MSAEPAALPGPSHIGDHDVPGASGLPVPEREPEPMSLTEQTTHVIGGSDASDEDGLALLPKHTVVRIIGNNRTKQAYVGQRAVVRRAVGLGGWHWLILENKEEIKLQRNALLVLQHPTGEESDFSDEEEEEVAVQPSMDALAGPVVFDSPGSGRRSSARAAAIARINLNKLDMAALRRYRSRYCLPDTGPHTTKDQLIVAVAEHLDTQTVDERTVLAAFLTAVKRRRATS